MSEAGRTAFADATDHRGEACRTDLDGVASLDETRPDPIPEPGDTDSALPPLRPRSVAPIHSSEISGRAFRTVFRGLDPEGVREWLQLIEASQEVLEDEVERLSRGWDELLLAAARLRASLSEPDGERAIRWDTLARCLGEARPNPELAATTTGFARAALDEAARGRRSAQAALFDAATQLARLQHETAVLRRENELLRSRLIETLAGTVRS